MRHATRRPKQPGSFSNEISNYCKPDYQCQHNLEYWFGREYAGYGPGAVASYGRSGERVRTTNLKHPERYCEAIEAGNSTEFEVEELSKETLRVERIMLGLRLNQGLDATELDLPMRTVEKLLSRQWIEVDRSLVKLTAEGRHFCSEVVLELI